MLFSRAVASQVSSPLMSLTSVFGMGTGGPSSLLVPTSSSSTSRASFPRFLKEPRKLACVRSFLLFKSDRRSDLITRGMRCFSHCTLKTEQRGDKEDLSLLFLRTCRLSPRAISTGQLNTLPCLHLRPINQIVSLGPYSLEEMGDLILGGVSRLDAFSVYLVRT